MAQENVSKMTAWVVGVLAFIGLGATALLSMGISVIFWAPVAVLLGIGMFMVWAGRRRRLMLQNRNANEVKDPQHVDRQWPTEGVIDDRLPGR
jgi:hypothetical protein